MKIEQIRELFNNGIDEISNSIGYEAVANMRNNLYKLDTINRILLYTQNKDAFDVRTALEWSTCNRDIRINQKPIYLVVPYYKTKYIDSDSNNEINVDDLNVDELNKALEYGIITKHEDIESTNIESYFDIRQTKPVNNINYSIEKHALSSGKILMILKDITGYSIEESEIDYCSDNERTVFISKKSYKELAKSVSKILCNYYIKRLTAEDIVNTSEFSDYDKELLETTIRFGISTLCGVNYNEDFSAVKHTTKEKIIDIFNISNSIIIDVAARLDTNTGIKNYDAYHNLVITKKAEAILNIMEANSIYKIMKGE